MPGSHLFTLGLYQKNFLPTSNISGPAINMGCTRGRGSTTRMYNYCRQTNPNTSSCINQFINITTSNNISPTPVPPVPPVPPPDPQWSSLGSSFQDGITALAINENNKFIYVYVEYNGTIFQYNGTQWGSIAYPISQVKALAFDNQGILYAGGEFININNNVAANHIAKWNGTTWTPLGSGVSGFTVYSIAFDSNNNVYIGGQFTSAGGVSNTANIAKWDGSSWSALGTGLNNPVTSIVIDEFDILYAGGYFTADNSGTTLSRVAKWNGISWSALGIGLGNTVFGLALDSSNTVYACGQVYVVKFNGITWSSLGSFPPNAINVASIVIDENNNVYIGGIFTIVGGVAANNIAKWNGTSWTALGSGTNSGVSELAVDTTNNDIYVGGDFTQAGGINALKIAKWGI